jgi:hypothetical protein
MASDRFWPESRHQIELVRDLAELGKSGSDLL